MISMEEQKTKLSDELKEKEQIIETQKTELQRKQKVIDKHERTLSNLKLQKQKVKEYEEKSLIRSRQVRLIACSKKIISTGADLAKTSLRYLYALIMLHDTEEEENPKAIHDTSESDDKCTTVARHDSHSIRIIDSNEIVAAEKEWEKTVADEVIAELEDALRADSINAMSDQQSKYALELIHEHSYQKLLKIIQQWKFDIENCYSTICIPENAKPENVAYLIEVIVRFAVALTLFYEAAKSSMEEGFDLSEMMLLSWKHPVYVFLWKMLNSLMEALRKVAQWISNACKLQ